MEAVWVAFKVLNDGEEPPPGHQYMDCHMVFDIKLDAFHLKPRHVVRGHMAGAPTMLTYAGIVSHDTVQIALLIAVLNDLEVKACKMTFSLCHVRKRYGQCLDLSLEVM